MVELLSEELRINIVENQRKLCNAIGVPGRENEVREFIYGALVKFVDKAWIDPLGNVLGVKQGSDPKGIRIMFDAHMDEVGFMIRYIEQNGFLRFTPLGGIDKRLYPGSRVIIRAENGEHITGIIGMAPPHITSSEERNKSPDYFDLFIDIGAKSFEHVKEMHIDIGSTGVMDFGFEYDEKLGIMRGRAFDDRTGCNVLLNLAHLLSQSPKLPHTILFNFSIGEEVGGRGTGPGTYNLDPDIGIALENTIAADVPGVSPSKNPTSLLQGPALTVADNGCVYDERILDHLKHVAKNHSIPWQYKLPTFGGTNAGIFHRIGKGIPAATVSVPCRYIHSPYGQLFLSDIEQTIKLLYYSLQKPIDLQR